MRGEGKVAVVTGASSGLGAELARQLGTLGWQVGLTARRAVDLGVVAREIREAGGTAEVAPADASDGEATAAAFRLLVRRLGPVDLLIANAGVGLEVSARSFTAERFNQMTQVNLIGPAVALEQVLPAMIERQSGHVVAISSLAAYRGLPGSAGYSATKAGLTALWEGLRPELRRLGIAASVVHPGYVRTPMTAGQLHPQPFLMEADQAARIILRGLERQQPRIDFPGPMVALLQLAKLLPVSLFDPIAARILLGKHR